MVTEPDGTFITARQHPEMVRFTPAILPDGLLLTAPDGSHSPDPLPAISMSRITTHRSLGKSFHRAHSRRLRLTNG
ncbi:Uncharacterized Fe-S protein [Pantoea agglomerans]|uniref:Uncharacterized Fe-S protein n=1 Tax=Enterobacter agglomerans TaxID=549 RepID=A0A379AI81_ENTAG|nr:Uncharacterized Fe-S protein [Pantoea agglomerans]